MDGGNRPSETYVYKTDNTLSPHSSLSSTSFLCLRVVTAQSVFAVALLRLCFEAIFRRKTIQHFITEGTLIHVCQRESRSSIGLGTESHQLTTDVVAERSMRKF
jgi:hypothetical protein